LIYEQNFFFVTETLLLSCHDQSQTNNKLPCDQEEEEEEEAQDSASFGTAINTDLGFEP
jgi:hypothetical protein